MSPVEAFMPVLRAAEPFIFLSCLTYTTLESLANSSILCSVFFLHSESGSLSSTTTISTFLYVCARTDFIALGNISERLYVGVITLTFSFSIFVSD